MVPALFIQLLLLVQMTLRLVRNTILVFLTLVDREGKFVDGLGEFSNRYVKDYKDEKDYVDVNVDICCKTEKRKQGF